MSETEDRRRAVIKMDPSMEMYVEQLNRCLMPQTIPSSVEARVASQPRQEAMATPAMPSMELIQRALYNQMAASLASRTEYSWLGSGPQQVLGTNPTAGLLCSTEVRQPTALMGTQATPNNKPPGPESTVNDGKRKQGHPIAGSGMWRKYGQKRMKGKEFEGLDVFRCYYKCTFPGCQVRMQTEKHSWQSDDEARCIVRGTHTHPVEGQDNVPREQPLRIVQALAPNTPRIDNHFLTRVKQQKPFFSVIDSSNSMRIIFVSDTFEAGTGYNMQMAVHKSIFFMAGERTDRSTMQQIESAIQKKESTKQQLLLYKRTGEPIWVEMIVDPLGSQPYHLCLQTNITKPEEKKKKKKAANVQMVVKENTDVDHMGSGESVDNSTGGSGSGPGTGTDSGDDP